MPSVDDSHDDYPEVSPRFFGLASMKFKLLSSALAALRSTETVFSISVSTISANKVATCYTSTMFATSTECRRKRDVIDMISIGNDDNVQAPTQHETYNINISFVS